MVVSIEGKDEGERLGERASARKEKGMGRMTFGIWVSHTPRKRSEGVITVVSARFLGD